MLVEKTNNVDFPNLVEYKITVRNLELCFLPEANMVIKSLKFNGSEILGQRGGVKDYINKLSSFGFPLVSPWMGRLHSTEYVFLGETYTMKSEDLKLDPNGLPIHGLLTASNRWKYDVLERAHSIEVLGKYNYDETTKGFSSFPFKHDILLKYEMSKNILTIETKIINVDDKSIPVAFGYHPLFKNARVEGLQGLGKEIFLNSSCLPVIEFNPNDYDTTAQMFNMEESWIVDLKSNSYIDMRLEAKGFPYMLIWTPPNADFIAVEPMTSNIDPFLNGSTVINPGEIKATRIDLNFS
jgi:aldose 1-epimerase